MRTDADIDASAASKWDKIPFYMDQASLKAYSLFFWMKSGLIDLPALTEQDNAFF